MPGFDWNGNGKSDAFDHFMDMKIISDINDNNASSDFETDDFDTDDFDSLDHDEIDDIDVSRSELIGTLRNVSAQKNESKRNTTMDFQNELKQNLRSAETVQREARQQENDWIMMKAKNSLHDIKRQLIESAKYARTETKNGVTSVYCFYDLPYHYMNVRRVDNIDEIKQDQQRFALFRDPNLIYRSWNCYEVASKYSTEFWQYISALKRIAATEKISLEPVVYNSKENKMASFPTKLPNDYSMGWRLCVRATSVISVDENYKSAQSTSTTSQKPPVQDVNIKKETTSTQNTQDSNGATIVKSLVVIGLCVGAFAICLAGDMGKLGMGLLLIVAAILGYKILSK